MYVYIKCIRITVISAFSGRLLLLHKCAQQPSVGGDKIKLYRKQSFFIAVVYVDGGAWRAASPVV